MEQANEASTENSSLRSEIKLSVIFHALVFGFFAVKTVFFPSQLDPIQDAIRVDMVALPDKIDPNPLSALQTPEPVPKEMPKKEHESKVVAAKPDLPKPKPTTKDPEAINIESAKAKQKQALDKLKQMDAFERLQKEMEKESKQKANQAVSQVKYKGNVISPGTELTGINQMQADNYRGEVLKHMKKYWEVPQYIKKNALSTWVLVKFDESGNILSKNVVKSSGNPAFDEVVVQAIESSSPVPAPPGKFATIASVEGFLFRFTPEQ